MIKIQNFEIEHLMCFSPEDKNLRDNWGAFQERMAQNVIDPRVPMMSLVRNDFVIAIVALVEQRPHVAEAIIIKGIFVPNFKKEFFAAIYRLMNNMIFETFDLHRVEIAISTDWQEGDKWARKLGCKFEGIARSWSSTGQDHAIYAKVVK